MSGELQNPLAKVPSATAVTYIQRDRRAAPPQASEDLPGFSSSSEPVRWLMVMSSLLWVTSTSSSSKTKMKHFVDKHREELIQRIPLSDPILDGLLSKDLLTYEQYDAIRCSGTPQDKMRRLYSYINGWGDNDKDFLYKVLKRNYRAVIEHLERS